MIVRNSGGLAVVLDEGVLNLSLIFPEGKKRIGINQGYDAMWALVKEMFQGFDHEIEAREIVGSYCPGSYDLSIDGKKFAGISQRRIRNGVAVQIYLCVNGSGARRAELIKQFYDSDADRARQDEQHVVGTADRRHAHPRVRDGAQAQGPVRRRVCRSTTATARGSS